MPNSRASNKQQFGLTFKKSEVAAIDKRCEELGITRTDFFRMATAAALSGVPFLELAEKNSKPKK